MGTKIKKIGAEELRRKVQNHYIRFFVFLAIVIGLIITSIALGVYGEQPLLEKVIPVGIVIISFYPLYTLFKKAIVKKKELSQR